MRKSDKGEKVLVLEVVLCNSGFSHSGLSAEVCSRLCVSVRASLSLIGLCITAFPYVSSIFYAYQIQWVAKVFTPLGYLRLLPRSIEVKRCIFL